MPDARPADAPLLACVRCGSPMACPSLALDQALEGEATCGGCGARFSSYCGVIDFRGPTEPTCWTEAQVVPERVLVERLVSMFRTASIGEMIDEYVNAYRLPPGLLDLLRIYMRQAETREQWAVRYFEFSTLRYLRRPLGGQAALEAGCGSGGGLPHLAARFVRVIGVDVDLAALIIAARRCIDRGDVEECELGCGDAGAAGLRAQHI